ncbi:MAG: prenyltransferase [Proteobacteria bacterium]|nr:prenyltransferase [Pseudomonadota bacterium]
MTEAAVAPLARRWWYASKSAGWPKLLVPMGLGQAIGLSGRARFDWPAFAVALCFTWFGLLFIVLLNDWGDREVDSIKRRMFPKGCSPKTIPDGILSARKVLAAGVCAGVVAAAAALCGGTWIDRPWLGPMGLGAMGLFHAYTFAPLRLNYRGGGELLEAVGVGVALPWLNAYAQNGKLLSPALWVLAGNGLLAFASAVASGLSDEQSDRAGGKTTLTTFLGNAAARTVVETSTLLGALAWLLTALSVPAMQVAALAAAVVLWHHHRLRKLSPRAVTNAFCEHKLYKQQLHRAVWGAGALLAALIAVQSH